MNALDNAFRRDQSTIIKDPVFVRDGVLHVHLGGRDLPLLMGGPIEHFLAGWRASLLFTGFAPLFLLELTHTSGATATWFLDYRMHHAGDAVAQLTPELRTLLKLRAIPLLQRLVHTVLEQCDPELDAPCKDFLLLDPVTRHDIGFLCLDVLIPVPCPFLVDHLMPHTLVYRGDDDVLRTIDRGWLIEGLLTDWQDRFAGYLRGGRMTWLSPVDGTTISAQGGILFDDFHFAFRFCDPLNRLVFHVIIGEHRSRIAGVWFPSLNLLLSHDMLQRSLAGAMIPALPTWVMTHAMRWADKLIPYLQRGATRFASVMRGRPGLHIGHQLWNELSGIDRLVQDAPDALPEWIVLDAAEGIELYGPLDAVFPELRGHVNRTLADIGAMTAWAYETGTFVLRVTRDFISAGLRERVQAHLAESVPGRQAAGAIAAVRGSPVVLFGLRVENRTLVDLPGVLLRLMTALAERFPGLVVVFDGHNARDALGGSRFIESHGEGRSHQPVDAEHRLVADCRAALSGLPITVVDTIGKPIATSIAWCLAANCFVSIWGAGLAKYRWVCNASGFVMSSQINLRHRVDLHIYDAADFLEAPTPLIFADPDAVTDHPDAERLIDMGSGQPSFFNFSIDEARMVPAIVSLIERSISDRPRSTRHGAAIAKPARRKT